MKKTSKNFSIRWGSNKLPINWVSIQQQQNFKNWGIRYIHVESRLNNCFGQSEVRVAKVSDKVHESLVIFAPRLFSNGKQNAKHLYSVCKKKEMIKNKPDLLC